MAYTSTRTTGSGLPAQRRRPNRGIRGLGPLGAANRAAAHRRASLQNGGHRCTGSFPGGLMTADCARQTGGCCCFRGETRGVQHETSGRSPRPVRPEGDAGAPSLPSAHGHCCRGYRRRVLRKPPTRCYVVRFRPPHGIARWSCVALCRGGCLSPQSWNSVTPSPHHGACAYAPPPVPRCHCLPTRRRAAAQSQQPKAGRGGEAQEQAGAEA